MWKKLKTWKVSIKKYTYLNCNGCFKDQTTTAAKKEIRKQFEMHTTYTWTLCL